jgi:hypothetical protein
MGSLPKFPDVIRCDSFQDCSNCYNDDYPQQSQQADRVEDGYVCQVVKYAQGRALLLFTFSALPFNKLFHNLQ